MAKKKKKRTAAEKEEARASRAFGKKMQEWAERFFGGDRKGLDRSRRVAGAVSEAMTVLGPKGTPEQVVKWIERNEPRIAEEVTLKAIEQFPDPGWNEMEPILSTTPMTVKELICRYVGPKEEIEAAVDKVLDGVIKDEKTREGLKNGTIKVRECDILDVESIEGFMTHRWTADEVLRGTLQIIMEKFNGPEEQEGE
jgi:hypothetical protein